MCAGIFLQSLLGMSVATVACFPRTTAVGCRNYSCYSFDSFSLEYVKCEVIFCLEINDAASARVKLSSLKHLFTTVQPNLTELFVSGFKTIPTKH